STINPTTMLPMRMEPPLLTLFTDRNPVIVHRSFQRLSPAAPMPPLSPLPQVLRGVDRLVAHGAALGEASPLFLGLLLTEALPAPRLQSPLQRPAAEHPHADGHRGRDGDEDEDVDHQHLQSMPVAEAPVDTQRAPSAGRCPCADRG